MTDRGLRVITSPESATYCICTDEKDVRKMLDIWPSLPIVISSYATPNDEDNIVAALEHNDRVCDIYVGHVSSSPWETIMAEMQEPFPTLTHLHLDAIKEGDSFLGGCRGRRHPIPPTRSVFPALTNFDFNA